MIRPVLVYSAPGRKSVNGSRRAAGLFTAGVVLIDFVEVSYPRLNFLLLRLKLSLHFAANDVAEIVQYCLHCITVRIVHCTPILSLIKISPDWGVLGPQDYSLATPMAGDQVARRIAS